MNLIKKTIFSILLPETIVAIWEFLHDFNCDVNWWDQFNG